MTLQGAMRYDQAWSYYVEQQVGPTRFLPTAACLPRVERRHWVPRHQPAGWCRVRPVRNGKTALKFNAGRYLGGGGRRQRQLLFSSCHRRASPTSTTRTWTDANRNFTPDCDLMSGVGAGSAAERRRLLRRVDRSELREERHHAFVRRADPQGLVQPAERLEHRRDSPARNAAARLGRGRLHPPLAPELHGH